MATKNQHTKHYRQPGQKPRTKLTKKEVAQFTEEFLEKQHYLRNAFKEVTPLEYYRDMFPEGSFELENDLEAHKPNALASVLIDQDQPGRRYNRIIFDDLAMIEELKDKEFVVVPPIGYSGKKRLSKMAYCFYGMCIDLDDVGIENIEDLIFQMQNKVIPYATYLVNSGTGLHIVYLFDAPIPAYPKYFESLGKLKHELSDMIWNKYTSRTEEKQYQGIFQGYRMVGTPTKISDECRVTAFKVGERVTINYLNGFVEPENQCLFNDVKYTSLAEAKEKWPEWYQRRIIDGKALGYYLDEFDEFDEKDRKQLERRRRWYECWKERINVGKGAIDGNRHHCICVLFNYAMKAGIDIEEALEDALGLIPEFNKRTKRPGNQFTEDDVYCALVYADRKYIKMGLKAIERMTGIELPRTVRNGNKREWHLEDMRDTKRKMKLRGKKFKNPEGRPPEHHEKVRTWRLKNPTKSKSACARELGISRATVYKWWDVLTKEEKEEEIWDYIKN